MNHQTQLLKTCRTCKTAYPNTVEYFYFSRSKDKLESECKPCVCQRAKKWRLDNPEHAAENAKQWARRNPEKRRKIQRDYVARHRQKHLAAGKEWRDRPEVKAYRAQQRKQNIEWMRKYLREWRKKNPDKFKAIQERYHETHKEKRKVCKANRRAREYSAEGSHTPEDIKRQYELQGGLCYWCNTPLDGKYHLDHLIPLAVGGTNNPDNLVCSCPKCNLRKWKKLPDEFMKIISETKPE